MLDARINLHTFSSRGLNISQQNQKVPSCAGRAGSMYAPAGGKDGRASTGGSSVSQRFLSLLDTLRTELEGAVSEAQVYKQQKDDFERKRKHIYMPNFLMFPCSSHSCSPLFPLVVCCLCCPGNSPNRRMCVTSLTLWRCSRGPAAGAQHFAAGPHGARALSRDHDSGGMCATRGKQPHTRLKLIFPSSATLAYTRCTV